MKALKTQFCARTRRVLAMTALVVIAPFCTARAQTAEEFNQLKAMVEQMQKTIDAQNARINELEKAGKVPPPPAPPAVAVVTNHLDASPSYQTVEKIAAGEHVAEQSPITYRGAMNDQQEAASRPKDYTLDPTFQGFIPVPNTPVLVKFNAKPHVDFTSDNDNAGNQNRFVPASFPLSTDPSFGGGEQFHANANATQLKIDVRAPDFADGTFRFYYQNDFFGSGSDTGDMKYRVQHLYGQLYGFKAGFTYGVFEDPDSWPDTVDYEGPNAVIFSRRPVAQYTHAWSENWNTTFGVEKPDIFVDTDSAPNPAGASTLTPMPDLGFNTRYEKADLGHAQFSALFRDIGASTGNGDDQHVFGWGINLSVGLDLTKNDTVQLLGVYGHGVGGQGNDSGFLNSDAAFNSNGNLKALPYWSAMAGYTHRWSTQFRSTLTYGYVNLDSLPNQLGTTGNDAPGEFYHISHYASANIVWQLRKRLSIGLEGLYGFKEAQNGVDSGNHWRIQLGMVYSLFD